MAEIKNLKLYMREGCGFCVMVMREMNRLGMDVPLNNIWQDESHNQSLIKHTGRTSVPVLYYEDTQGQGHWMPESIEIIYFLRKHFEATKAL